MKTEKEYLKMLQEGIEGLQKLGILIAFCDNYAYDEELTIFPYYEIETEERNYHNGKKEYLIILK